MSSDKSRQLNGIVNVENFIHEEWLESIARLISDVPNSMNAELLVKQGHRKLESETRLIAIVIGSFLQHHYNVNLNIADIHPSFFRKTKLDHQTEIHADNENLDGCPKMGCENFDVSAIIYFNDDFEGGELWFPQQDLKIKPKKGSFIAFPGDARYAHGVLPISMGIRYSAPMWFTITD